ncbi:MAG TPA: hypothetical protein PK156_01435 [Polyangium sp.]|nr:hypothetical protein [Polyangium sp.]
MKSHPALMTLRILWFALLMSTFLYMGIAYGVLAGKATVPQIPIMPPVLAALSLVLAATSFLLPRFIYPQAAKTAAVKIEEEVASNSAFPDRYREASPKQRVFADPSEAMSKAFACFMTPFILSLALSEAIALFGLVLAQLGFETILSVPFFVAGAVLIAIRFPQQATVVTMFEKVHGAVFPQQNS